MSVKAFEDGAELAWEEHILCQRDIAQSCSEVTTSEAGASDVDLSTAASMSEVAFVLEGAMLLPGGPCDEPVADSQEAGAETRSVSSAHTDREVVTWADLHLSTVLQQNVQSGLQSPVNATCLSLQREEVAFALQSATLPCPNSLRDVAVADFVTAEAETENMPPLETHREVATWVDLAGCFLLDRQFAPVCQDALWSASGGTTAATVPLVLDGTTGLGDETPQLPTLPAEALPADSTDVATLEEEALVGQLSEEMPASSRSKSTRRSRRRRRPHAAKKTSTLSDASSACGSPAEPSPSDVEDGAFTRAGELSPQHSVTLTAAVRGGSASVAPPAQSLDVVTLSDLGLEFAPPPGGAEPSKARCPMPVCTIPHAVQACDAKANELGASGGAARGGQPPPPPTHSPELRPHLSGPSTMRTRLAYGPCHLSADVAEQASQRILMATTVVAPMSECVSAPEATADHDGATPLIRSWLHASGLPSSGTDLMEKLRALAPNTYED